MLVATASGTAFDPSTGVHRQYVSGQQIPATRSWNETKGAPYSDDGTEALGPTVAINSGVMFETGTAAAMGTQVPLWEMPDGTWKQVTGDYFSSAETKREQEEAQTVGEETANRDLAYANMKYYQ